MTSMLMMRGAGGSVGAFWDIIQVELDKERFEVSDRKLALRLDVSPSTISNWKAGLNSLPSKKNLRAVADFLGKSYEEVLLVALGETGHAEGTRLARRTTIADAVERELTKRHRGGNDDDVLPSPQVDRAPDDVRKEGA